MEKQETTLEDLVSLAKRRGFIYQGSEIYGGLAGTWDYGPLGVQLKRNISELWHKLFVDGWDDMYEIESAILMNPQVWHASGHVETFNDPLVECAHCHMRFRQDKIDTSRCPNCGQSDTFGEARQFNLLFKTHVGPIQDEANATYLRGETAQGMFTNFKNIVDVFQPDLPFGIAQSGKAFRNEISPRDFVFRVREFEIMELEYFVHPDKWQGAFEKWQNDFQLWFEQLGLPAGKIKTEEVSASDRAHYSKRTVDFLYEFPTLGFDEIGGLAYRTDFDLANHQKHSGKNLMYRPKDGSDSFTPHVIEPTWGLDRHVLAVLSQAFTKDEINGETRLVLKLPPKLAPVKIAVSPLLKNRAELISRAREIYKSLQKNFTFVMWDDNGNIGKRYRRQDEIGTPYCVTIDFQTLEDNTVTVRDRDTTTQKRINANGLFEALKF